MFECDNPTMFCVCVLVCNTFFFFWVTEKHIDVVLYTMDAISHKKLCATDVRYTVVICSRYDQLTILYFEKYIINDEYI